MKAKNWCYGILITIVLAVFILILSGFCFPGTFTGTITQLTDTCFTLQSTEPGVQAQAVAVKWPDTPTVEIGDTVTVRYYRKTHGAPMGLYIYKMEVKAEAEVDLSASASVEYRENQSEVRVKQGGEYYRLYQMTVYSYGYVEEADSFAADTGPRLRNLGPEERENLPVITWAEDFSLDVPEDLRLDRIDVYDENGEEVNLLFLLAVLIHNSGLVFAAYAVWIVYLAIGIKNTDSRAVKVTYIVFIIFAAIMLGGNAVLMFQHVVFT